MSLEVAIQENTSALRELIAALAHGVPTTSAQVEKVAADAAAVEKVAPTYPDVVAAINKMGGVKGREAVIALLKTFGATKGPELKPEHFADFIAKAAV